MKVCHVINSLAVGGAERFLLRLSSGLSGRGVESLIVPLVGGGELEGAARSAGQRVEPVGMRKRFLPAALLRLRAVVREFRPDVIQGWLYAGNAGATVAQKLAPGNPALVWNFRHTIVDLADESLVTRLSLQFLRWQGQRPNAIIHNSSPGEQSHAALGLSSGQSMVISNGFDTSVFFPDEAEAQRVRRELGWSKASLVVAVIGRNHPMKGHDGFLRVAASVARQHPNVRFAMIGRGLEASGEVAKKMSIGFPEAMGQVDFLGPRDDVANLLRAVDVLALPSLWGEGSPNVVGEAMSSGVPCLVSDVGGAAELVGNPALVHAPGDWKGLDQALTWLVGLPKMQRQALGSDARARIEGGYTLAARLETYEKLYRELDAVSSSRRR